MTNPVGGELDPGALKAANPDLIIGRQGALFNRLSLIAPTVITEPGSGQWKLNLRLVGEALGRTNDAEALLTDYDRRVAGARRAIEGRPTVAVARAAGEGWRLAPRDSFAGTILADVGLRQVHSLERADLILASRPPGARVDGGAGADGSAGADGGVKPVDAALWWGPGGAFAARAALEDLQRIVK